MKNRLKLSKAHFYGAFHHFWNLTTLVPIHSHYMEKSSVKIQVKYLCVPWKKVMRVYNNTRVSEYNLMVGHNMI